ncbi:MAG: glycosyltransferase family 2 protein [Micrococcaceae bacterium]
MTKPLKANASKEITTVKLTIGVPVFNAELWLKDFLKEFDRIIIPKDIEATFVFTDDGSKDRSLKILKSYYNKSLATKQVIVIENKQNLGLGATRNKIINWGLTHNTDYFWFIDCDDSVDPNIFKYTVPFMQQGIDLISFGLILTTSLKSANNTFDTHYKTIDLTSEQSLIGLFTEKLITPSTNDKVLHADLLRKFSFKEGLIEDLFFTARLLFSNKAHKHIKKNLYYYAQGNNTLTKSNKFFLNLIPATRKTCDFAKNNTTISHEILDAYFFQHAVSPVLVALHSKQNFTDAEKKVLKNQLSEIAKPDKSLLRNALKKKNIRQFILLVPLLSEGKTQNLMYKILSIIRANFRILLRRI